MLIVQSSTQFRKDLKKSLKSGKDLKKLEKVIRLLEHEETLPQKYDDHPLKGNYKDCRDCHIEPDWLLIYMIEGDLLKLLRIGSHSQLF
jgi:mRNA interferase YafQ